MGSRRARLFASTAAALLLLAATVAFAASSGLSGSPHTATAAVSKRAAAPRPLLYACARNLYNAKKVLRYIARPSQCKGSGTTLVRFSKDYPVYTCRKEHGGFAARQRHFPYPVGIRGHGPAGLMRMVDDPSKCAPPSQPNETPITLPRTTPRMFCAAKRTGELRWVNSAKACDAKEFPVLLAPRIVVGNSGSPVAGDDDATTDEDHAATINVLANDRNTPSSNSNAGLQVASTNTTGTQGTVTVNPDGTITYDPAGKFESLKAGQTATDAFTYKVKKGSHSSDPAIVTVTITGVNDAPVAKDDSASTDSAHTKAIPVLSNDTDADGDTLTVASLDTAGTQGTVTKNGDGTVTYNPGHAFDSLVTGATAHDTFKYKANDGHVDSNAATVDVTVTGAEDPPVVTTTSGSTAYTENDPATVIDGGVTVTDPDDTNLESAQVRVSVNMDSGDTLDYTSPGPGGITGFYSAGTGVLSLSGTASKADYQAALRSVKFVSTNDNPAATKTIEFKANDGDLDSNLATKDIALTRVNDAPSVTTSGGNASFTEDSPATQVDPGITVSDPDSDQVQGASAAITGNFTSADGDALGFSNQNGISGSYNSGTGVLTLTGNASKADYETALGSITFSNTSNTPSTATRTVSFKVTDTSAAHSNTATRDVGVTAHNDAPTATADSGSTAEDTTLTVNAAAGVLGNDTDPEGDGLTAVKVTNSAHGTLTLNSDGSYDYTPNLNYNGPDAFTYKAKDASDDSNVATVSLTVSAVNDAPVATDDSYSTAEDTVLNVVAPGVLSNDSDVDGDSITATIVSNPAHDSSFTFNANGSFSYTPDANYNGPDSFTYHANDGSLGSNTVTVSLTVSAVNDAPVDSVPGTTQTLNEDSSKAFSTAGANAITVSDLDAGSGDVSVTVQVSHGTLTLGSTAGLSSNTGNGTGSVTIAGTVSAVNSALDGLTYAPNANYNGSDTLSVFTNDNGNTGSGGSKTDTDTVALQVDPVNDAPVATGDSDTTNEDSAVTTSVLANDTDVDGDTLTPQIVTGPTSGSAVVNGNGTITYTPNGNFNGADSYTYKDSDGSLDSNTVTVNITVNAVNDAPAISVPGTQTMNEDSQLTLSGGNAPSIADVDVGGSNMTVTLGVSHGKLTLSGTSGLSVTGNGTASISATGSKSDLNAALDGLKYDPAANFDGADSISVGVNDNGNTGSGGAKTDSGSIGVNVTAVNDGPVNSVPASQNTNEDTPLTFSTGNSNKLSFDDSDSATDDLTITVTTVNGTSALSTTAGLTVTGNGTNSIQATGTESALNTALDGLVFTPTADYFGAASVELLTNDNGHNGTGGALTDDDTVAITVNSVNDAPVGFAPTTQSTPEDTALTFSPVPTVTDADAGADDVEVTLAVDHGTLSLATTLGISFQGGTNDNSASMTFRGTTSAVNDALNGLKYTPTPDYNGSATFSIDVSDLGHNGSGGTLTNSDSTAITVTAANDAPVVDLNGSSAGTGTSPTFLEVVTHDNSVTLAPGATVTDIDDTDMTSADVTLTNRPDGSAESLSATGTPNITVDAYDSSTGLLHLHGTAPKSEYAQVLQSVTYSNTAAPPNPTARSITFTVNDGDVNSAAATATVQVTPLNTPPIVDLDTTNAGSFDSEATFTEDSPAVNIAPNPSITDADAADTHMESATVTLTNRPDGANESLSTNASGTSGITVDAYDNTTGVLLLHGHGTIADYETLISRVKYDNTSQAPDTTDRDITVVVNDGQADSITRHATVHVNQHNDPIQNSVPGAQAFDEDTTRTFTAANSNVISVADADAGSGSIKVTISADHGSLSSAPPAGGTRTGNATHSLELTGTVSAVNAVLDGLNYSPDANYNGADTITVASDDQGNTGGAATTDSDTIGITLNAVNDAPSNTVPGSQSVNEDTALPFSSGTSNQISTADVDAGASPVEVQLSVSNGKLTMTTLTGLSFTVGDGTSDSAMTFTGTLANVNAALNTLSYTGNANYNGPDSLQIITNDQGNTGTGGAKSDTDTVGITVNPVNDAPTASSDNYATDEDTQLNVAAPGVLSNDTDIDSGSLTAVKVTDPANGSVTLNSDGSFTYQPNPNFNGADSFTYKANDGSLDSNTVTVNLTVNAVNDAPSNTVPGSQSVDEDTQLTFNSGNGNLISTSDVDAGANQVKVTLSALHGGITLSGTSGLSFACGGCAGDGSGDPTMTFTGTLTNVNAALDGMSYLGTLNYNGPDQLTLTVNDQGFTGAGGAKQDSDVIGITVNPVNDAPVAGDETFNATNSAIGNTTLNVNDTATTGAGAADGRPPTPDPTDTSPTTDRPHKEITGNIFANDTDVDNNSNEFTAVPGTFATNDGGTVTIQSDGDFNFEPAPSTSCTDNSDFFDYTVSDNVSSGAGPNPGTDTGRVTVAITGCVWYVNNNDAQGNSGTSEKPFDTTAQAQTASGNNQTTFVYDGDDTTTGYNTGYTMNTGESLLSEGATLQIGSDTLHTADAANKASLTNNNADVVTLAPSATVKSFNIDPQGTGGGIFGTGLGATTVTLDDLNVVDNGTKGTQPGLELDTNSGTTTNASNLTVNNGDGSSATTGDTGVKLNNTGTVNFASTGTISITTNGAAGLIADGTGTATSLGSASTFDDITVTNSGNGGVRLLSTTGSGTAFGDGSGTDLNLTTVSGSSPAFSVQTAGSFSVPSAGTSNVSATGGPAVDVVSSTGSTMPFDSVSSTNSANDGVNIDGIGTGTFSATSGSVGGEAGIGFDLNGGSGAITYPGTFNNGSGPLVAEVTGRTGGVVSLAGSMNDNNDAGGGVNVANNTGGSTVFSGATKQYNTGASDAVTFSNSDGHTFVLSGGGSDIDTTSGNGVNVTTSGTFQVSGSGNTIDSTALGASNRALNIADTDIAAADVTFEHVNSSGGTNGIRLNNNGNSAGGLTVTGIGGTCTAADQTGCSGGTIQSATGAGIDLASDSGEVSLTRMNVKNGGDDGIHASSVGTSAGNGIGLANSVISGNGNAVNENGIDYDNVLGISSLNSSVFTGSAEDNARINATSGTGRFTVDSSTFSSNSTTLGGDGLKMTPDGSSSVRALVQNSTFQANRDDGFQLNAQGDANTDLQFNSNTVHAAGNAGAVSAHAGLNFDSGTTSDTRMSMNGGTVDGADGSAIIINPAGDNSSPAAGISSTFNGSYNNVTVGTSGVAGSGSATGLGIWAKPVRNVDSAISITNSHINGTGQFGMQLLHNDGQGNSDFTVTGNTFRTIGTGNEPIFVQAGSLSTDVINMCADIGGTGGDNTNPPGNDFAGQGSGGVTDIAFRRPSADAGSHLKLPGFSPPASSNLQPYIQGRNVGNPTAVNFSGELEAGPASCQQPTAPTAP